MIEEIEFQQLKKQVDDLSTLLQQERQYRLDAEYRFNAHKHIGTDLTKKVPFIHRIPIRLVASGTNTATGNIIAGDYVVPFNGFIVNIEATVDTAGTTNTTDIDVNLNGTSIMSTKLKIDSGEKTTRTAATRPAIKVSGFVTGDIFTFDVDQISSTPAKGLTIHLDLQEN